MPLTGEKRACCLLLQLLSRSLDALQDATVVKKALDTISKHCMLMKLFGQSKIKWDLAKSDCLLAILPEEAKAFASEIGITRAIDPTLEDYDGLIAFLNGILAHNAVSQQIHIKKLIALAAQREGEKRFGRVPDTPLIQEENRHGNEFNVGERLKAHPLLAEKPQFDGIDPKSNPNPVQNPEAAENKEQLQNQLQHQYRPQPTITPTPTMRPKGS